jgi:hypothetical protein
MDYWCMDGYITTEVITECECAHFTTVVLYYCSTVTGNE